MDKLDTGSNFSVVLISNKSKLIRFAIERFTFKFRFIFKADMVFQAPEMNAFEFISSLLFEKTQWAVGEKKNSRPNANRKRGN